MVEGKWSRDEESCRIELSSEGEGRCIYCVLSDIDEARLVDAKLIREEHK